MNERLKNIVRRKYNQIALQSKEQNQSSCCGSTNCCDEMDYTIMSDDYTELKGYSKDADLGLGCGLPTEYAEIKERIDQYLFNARMVCDTMDELGLSYVGGDNSPYIWINGNGRDSWGFFDLLLEQAGIVCTPVVGFGPCGEGYIRISAFNSPENVKMAMSRMKEVLAS